MHLVGVTDCRRVAIQPNWVDWEMRRKGEMLVVGVVVVVVVDEADDDENVGIRWACVVVGVDDGDDGSLAIDQCVVDVIVANVVLLDRVHHLEFGVDDELKGRRCAEPKVVAELKDDSVSSDSNGKVNHGEVQYVGADDCAA